MVAPFPARPGPPTPLVPLAREPRPASPLPRPLAPFVGRQRELARLRALLHDPAVRLLTLTGPGGVGKTRLALRAAAEREDDGPWAVAFVSLAAIADHLLVIPTIAQALGVGDGGDRPLLDGLKAALADRSTLLLLDNFEQVLDAAPLVSDLLAACPALKVLATSRAALHVYGERTYPIAPMPLPAPEAGGDPDRLAELVDTDAVRLFVTRAAAVQPDFALTAATAAVVAEICRRLDGLPLAIELASARVGVLPPSALLERLERRLPVLVGGPRDAPARQRTLRDAIAWSYDLLTPDEQTLFRRLAVFAGGFTLDAAEAVSRGESDALLDSSTPRLLDSSVLDGVASLVDSSLLRQRDGETGGPRFEMLETIREYARERFDASDEAPAIRDRHAAWCLDLAERAARSHRTPEQGAWLARLQAEEDNLRAALGSLLARRNGDTALRLAGALGSFWSVRGPLGEGRRWLEQALAAAESAPGVVRATALRAAGVLALYQAAFGPAEAWIGEALAIHRSLGDRRGAARDMALLAGAAEFRGDDVRAADWYDEALAHFAALGERTWVATALESLADIAYRGGDLRRAGELSAQALASARAAGDPLSLGLTLVGAAQLAIERADLPAAVGALHEAVDLARGVGDKNRIADTLVGFARVAAATGQLEVSARLLGAVAAHGDATGSPLVEHHEQHRRALDDVRAALPEAAFTAAFEAGGVLSLEQAIAEAEAATTEAAVAAPPIPPTAPPPLPAGQALTPREIDVLRLLVEGKSDREIAAALGVTYRTTTTYVTGILTKLNVASRTAAATYAVRHGLV